MAAALGLASATPAAAGERYITLASTTSTENSGLFAYLLPQFEADTGIAVRVVAVGTGQAFRLGQRGDADVLLVHDRAGEDAFVAAGYGVERRDVMYNDFVIVGPATDPAGIRGLDDVAAALARIAERGAVFVSRGDDSGTHRRERALWKAAGLNPERAPWYRETGAGMGATLNVAAGLDGYTLVDRATWVAFRNKGDLALMVEGDRRLFNPYGVILVNPARHPHVKAALGRAFISWLVSARGQALIAAYTVDGVQLFHPDAGAAS